MEKQKKHLLLITAGFPYGESERGFLSTEFFALTKEFDLTIAARGTEDKLVYPVPPQVKLYRFAYHKPTKGQIAAQVLRREIRQDMRESLKDTTGAKNALHRISNIVSYWGTKAAQLQPWLEKIVQQEHIEIIYAYWCLPSTIAALRLKEKYPNLKVISRFHGFDLYRERDEHGWQPLRSYVVRNCDKLVFVSKKGKDYFNQHWGGAEKSVVSYLGCRAIGRLPEYEDDTLRLISCARCIPLKRIELQIEALALLPREMKVSWTHIGDGEALEALRQLAEKMLKDRPNISWQFTGSVPNSELPQVYAQVRPQLFLTASSTEGGLPISILEANAMGVPALATAVGGIPDGVRDGQTGYLLPENPTAQQVADGILKFAALSAEEKRRMSDTAFMIWQTEFDAEKTAQNMVQLLNEL